MEVYAAMVENLDANIGRIIQSLKDAGRYDDTFVFFESDNGAAGEPPLIGGNANTNNALENIGRPLSNVAYGRRWAEVSATPFRLFKGFSSEGGRFGAGDRAPPPPDERAGGIHAVHARD
jgi:arylsulfatase A-like enzyme